MPSVFDMVRGEWPDKATAWDLGKRPVRSCCSDARALDPETMIVADCEPEDFRLLAREWHDRGTAEYLAEAVHQRELERAAQPPVIEVTVTTPPGGIPRLELERAVAETVQEFAAARLSSLRPAARVPEPGAAVVPDVDDAGWLAVNPSLAVPYVCEDDTPTVELPAIQDASPLVTEVRVP